MTAEAAPLNAGAPAHAAPLLDVEGLSVEIKVPGGMLHAVTDVSFSVAPGETFCLVGKSGCGKTMTALALMQLLPRKARFKASRIAFEGRDLFKLGEREMAALRGNRFGMIFQDPMTSLNPVYTIGNQLEEVYLRHRSGPRRDARERAEYLLARAGVNSPKLRLAQFPHQLSGGLRQRMMIAMALMCEPSLLIADEPTTSLDVTVQVQILRLFKELAHEFRVALILITHDLGIVAQMAQRVAVMYAGRIVETGTVAEVLRSPQHPYTQGLLECVPVAGADRRARLGSIPGIVPSLIGASAGCSFRNRCHYATAPCAGGEIAMRELGNGRGYRCVLGPDALSSTSQHAVRAPSSGSQA